MSHTRDKLPPNAFQANTKCPNFLYIANQVMAGSPVSPCPTLWGFYLIWSVPYLIWSVTLHRCSFSTRSILLTRIKSAKAACLYCNEKYEITWTVLAKKKKKTRMGFYNLFWVWHLLKSFRHRPWLKVHFVIHRFSKKVTLFNTSGSL